MRLPHSLPMLAAWIIPGVYGFQRQATGPTPVSSHQVHDDVPAKSLNEKRGGTPVAMDAMPTKQTKPGVKKQAAKPTHIAQQSNKQSPILSAKSGRHQISMKARRTKQAWPKIQLPWHTTTSKKHVKILGDFEEWQSWSELVYLRNRSFVFCAIPKSASTLWKQLLLRISGVEHWSTTNSTLLHHPVLSGLDLVGVKTGHFSRDENGRNYSDIVRLVEAGDNLTKAVMVRDPVTRALSAYLDRCVDMKEWNRCNATHKVGFERLVLNMEKQVAAGITVQDVHFKNQTQMCGLQYMPYTLLGRYENFYQDSRFILENAGLWNKYGAKGWGPRGTNSFAAKKQKSSNHKSEHDTAALVCEHYTPELLERIYELYKLDFESLGYSTEVWHKRCRKTWKANGKLTQKHKEKNSKHSASGKEQEDLDDEDAEAEAGSTNTWKSWVPLGEHWPWS